MSTREASDILKTTLGLPAVISLLAAGAIGVWTCSNTLNDIRNKLDMHTSSIIDLNAKVDKVNDKVEIVSLQEHDTKLALVRIQNKIDTQ